MKATFDDIKVGSILYVTEGVEDNECLEITVTSELRTEILPSTWCQKLITPPFFEASYWGLSGRVETWFFLGDLGVEGYAYDDRPCKVYTTKEAAVEAAPAIDVWRAAPGR